MPRIKSNKRARGGDDGAEKQRQGLQFNKTFGQHILKNPLVITSMVDKVSFGFVLL